MISCSQRIRTPGDNHIPTDSRDKLERGGGEGRLQ